MSLAKGSVPMENNLPETIPYVVHESEMSRLERTVKRLFILCLARRLFLLKQRFRAEEVLSVIVTGAETFFSADMSRNLHADVGVTVQLITL